MVVGPIENFDWSRPWHETLRDWNGKVESVLSENDVHLWGHLGPPLFGTPLESSSVCRSVADQVGAVVTVMNAGRSTNNSLQDTID